MDIRVIASLEQLDAIRSDWEQAHANDPHATVFSSWPWMRGWLQVTPQPWSVLVAEDGGRCAGFMPISLRGTTHPYRIDQIRELCMAGDPVADYAGFVCGRDDQATAIPSFAEYIASELAWDRMRLRDIRDPRIDLFARSLPERSLAIEHSTGISCPHIALPTTWEEYERCHLSSETRRSLRKRIRDAESQCRFTEMDPADDAEEDIATLIRMASLRHPENPDPNLPHFTEVFRQCAAAGCAAIVTLLNGETPIAAQGMFIDRKHSAIRVYLSGFDQQFANLSPGRVLDAICIRRAIEQGLTDYDFLRGDEPYKFQFGAVPRHNRNFQAIRRNVGSAARMAVSRMRDSLRI